jgi:hypothetical protein
MRLVGHLNFYQSSTKNFLQNKRTMYLINYSVAFPNIFSFRISFLLDVSIHFFFLLIFFLLRFLYFLIYALMINAYGHIVSSLFVHISFT